MLDATRMKVKIYVNVRDDEAKHDANFIVTSGTVHGNLQCIELR